MSHRPFLLSATVDFPDDVRYGPYSRELLEEMVLQIKSLGVRRIYWLYYGDEETESYWARQHLRLHAVRPGHRGRDRRASEGGDPHRPPSRTGDLRGP